MGVMDEWTEKALEKLPEQEILDPQAEHERKVGRGKLEEEIIAGLRENAEAATGIQSAFLVHVKHLLETDQIKMHDLGAIMRATSDAQAKAVDAFLKMTGRAGGAPESDTMQLIRSLANDGLLRMNVEIEVGGKDA